MKTNRRFAFTLIELLVVIAIIALLAAILFPVFARARENARKTSCLSNVKQLALGIQQYTQDFDETLPNSTDGGGAGTGEGVVGGWTFYSVFGAANGVFDVTKGSIYHYLKSTQIYTCPSDTLGRKTGDSYAINACMVGGTRTNGIRVGRSLSEYNATPGGVSMWMLFGEENAGGSTDDGYMSTGNTFTSRHMTGTVIAFLDGHAKFIQINSSGRTTPVDYQYAGGASCPP